MFTTVSTLCLVLLQKYLYLTNESARMRCLGSIKTFFAAIVCAAALISCAKNPEDIVFGPEPMKEIAAQGELFKTMPLTDREDLVAYLTALEIYNAMPYSKTNRFSVAGQTVREALVTARQWKVRLADMRAGREKNELEAQALKQKALADQEAVAKRIATSVVVAIVGKSVEPKDYDKNRYYPMLVLSYAIKNKSDKAITQLKGRFVFYDATGDVITSLLVEFNQRIGAYESINTNNNSGWKMLDIGGSKEIEQLALRDFNSVKSVFEPASIAFEGGEVIKAQGQ